MRQKHSKNEMKRTVGSGFARNLWSVSCVSKDDLPTAASPTNSMCYCHSVKSLIERTGDNKFENIMPGNACHATRVVKTQDANSWLQKRPVFRVRLTR